MNFFKRRGNPIHHDISYGTQSSANRNEKAY